MNNILMKNKKNTPIGIMVELDTLSKVNTHTHTHMYACMRAYACPFHIHILTYNIFPCMCLINRHTISIKHMHACRIHNICDTHEQLLKIEAYLDRRCQ